MRVPGACNRPDSRQNDKHAKKGKNGGLGGRVEVVSFGRTLMNHTLNLLF